MLVLGFGIFCNLAVIYVPPQFESRFFFVVGVMLNGNLLGRMC